MRAEKQGPYDRLNRLRIAGKLSEEEVSVLSSSRASGEGGQSIENAIGFMPVPLGILDGLVVNNREYLVPMATTQKSVISLTSRGSLWAGIGGGFRARSMGSTMIGQVQLTGLGDLQGVKSRILANKEEILGRANTQSSTRRAFDLGIREVETFMGPMLVMELLVDVKDSMGANVVDSMCEAVAPLVEGLSGGRAGLRVLSNLATRRLVRAEVEVPSEVVGGTGVVDGIVAASVFAESDLWRAATHNKGVMNGVSAVLLATGNDTRAVEAGAHAYAALSGKYCPLSKWNKNSQGALAGELTMPMAVGIVGGAVNIHPVSRIALKLLGVRTAVELGEVAASAGLAYNLGALQAMVTGAPFPRQ